MYGCTVSWYEGEELKEIFFENQKVFSAKLKNLRKSRGLTIRELSKQIGWDEDCIRRWESNDVPLPRALDKLCSFFFVTQEYFLNGSMSNFEQLSFFE